MDAMVQIDALNHAESLCDSIESNLNDTAEKLKNTINNANSTWNDKQYVALKEKIVEICASLKQSCGDLEKCKKKISMLVEVVRDYEQ